jgi:hypothetical protein
MIYIEKNKNSWVIYYHNMQKNLKILKILVFTWLKFKNIPKENDTMWLDERGYHNLLYPYVFYLDL